MWTVRVLVLFCLGNPKSSPELELLWELVVDGGGSIEKVRVSMGLAEMMIAPKRIYVLILNFLTFPKYQKQKK